MLLCPVSSVTGSVERTLAAVRLPWRVACTRSDEARDEEPMREPLWPRARARAGAGAERESGTRPVIDRAREAPAGGARSGQRERGSNDELVLYRVDRARRVDDGPNAREGERVGDQPQLKVCQLAQPRRHALAATNLALDVAAVAAALRALARRFVGHGELDHARAGASAHEVARGSAEGASEVARPHGARAVRRATGRAGWRDGDAPPDGDSRRGG